ncbi:acyl-CoA thioesterase [Desulfatitalea alkaliphila]|uniref:Acyl-CoA thioesterase n=1 Tax=Desulfatitalea alkaliphila TaxID=2929485 RepID=A0AA41R5T8_9BACT|nr:thioesterase family protein [Desulfatitalea alkaliphila]MCJ8501620.1 acyl-CoA thioesterase [Desulfatitalea alkaliphila]
MGTRFETNMTVAFHDLDPLQIVWHGNYLKYFDIARFGLFASVGVDLYAYMLEKHYVFPVTRSSLKHIVPLRAFDQFTCSATVTECQYKIVLNFEIRKGPDMLLCARGSSEQLAVRFPEMEMEFQIPDDIRRALEG